MVTSIQLGNISQQNGKTVVTGSSSGGLDTEALLNALAEAKRLPAVQLEQRIEQNTLKSTAFGSMQDILNRFRDASNFLRNPPGVQNESENIFEYRAATVTNSGTTAGSNYLTVTAEPGASVSDYDVTVDQLATYNTKVTDTFALADPDQVAVGGGLPFNVGTLTLGASGTDVDIEAGDTLNEIVAKINAVEDESKVEASILKVADGQYRLVLKTTETGTDYNYDLGIPTPPSVITNDAVFRLDANDINGDGSYSDNPVADQAVAAPVDATGGTTIAAVGTTPTLDVDGTDNGIATFDFTSGTAGYLVTNSNDINAGGPYQEKAFAFSFTTGADISGTQTIYEQGGTGRSFGLFVDPDPGNGNAPTLFAVAFNNNEWGGADQFNVLNLGTVAANTTYDVVLDFDATANPAVNDPANTFTGYVNGVQIDQDTGVAEQPAHSGAIGIGTTRGGTGLPDGTTFGADGLNFRGEINEVVLFNKSLSTTEVSDISTYLDNKYVQPIATTSVLNVGFAVVEDAVDAEMTIDGTTITRGNNSIDDVIEGLTFNLLGETIPGDELTVSVDPDTELVKSAIFNFVDSYNEFRIFAAEQMQTNSDGTPTEDAVLAGSSTLRTALARVNQEVASVVAGITAGDADRLADIGINFSDFPGDEETPLVRNIMNIDESKLDSALAANFDEVRKVFEFDYTTDDPDLAVFQRTNALNATAVEVNIDQTNGIYQATYDDGTGLVTINLDGEALNGGGGVVLRGQDGTDLQGLVLIYADTDDNVVNLNLSQGIGDRVFNTIDEMLEEDTGLLPIELETIEDNNQRLQDEIDRIDEIVERYREQLLKQFSALEQAIATANTLLQSLAAQSDARIAAG